MEESFSNSVKEMLLSMNNDSPEQLIDRYNSYFGEDSYDDFLARLNEIENKYMLEEAYDERDLEEINGVVKTFLIRKLDDEVKEDQIDLRTKEITLEDYGSKMNDLVDRYVERSNINELPNKAKLK
jgi:hypothetical protein